jgi:hypothetical protein
MDKHERVAEIRSTPLSPILCENALLVAWYVIGYAHSIDAEIQIGQAFDRSRAVSLYRNDAAFHNAARLIEQAMREWARREYGDEHNEGGLAKLCAAQEKVNERNAALEETEKACEEEERTWNAQADLYRQRDVDLESSHNCALRAEGAAACASAIRALKSAPAQSVTAQQVWEAMREQCRLAGWLCEDRACWEGVDATPCAFATCPLLKEARDA